MRVFAHKHERPGAVLPLITILLVAFLSFVALATDIGMLTIARTQAQSAADIGALSGARSLNGTTSNNKANAIIQARAAATQNYILSHKINPTLDIPDIKCGMYIYTTDATTKTSRFQANFTDQPTSTDNYGAIQIRVETSRPTFFGKLMGVNSMTASAVATAVHRPRDIAVVLDFSDSMKYSSKFNYPPKTANITGGLSPDSRFPRFGPWSIYPIATVGNPNPMHRLDAYVDTIGNTFSPNNLTTTTNQGPAMVSNFQTNAGNNPTNAFVYNNDLSEASFRITNKPICTPVPASWSSQYANGYSGDRWPLKLGETSTNPSVSQYAKNVAQIIYSENTAIDKTTYDANWESNGYDTSPMTFQNGLFKGYSMGPGYYGKTFYVWPPDPRYDPSADPTKLSSSNLVKDSSDRWICDWRKRFFLKPSEDSSVPGVVVDDNSVLFDSAGMFRSQNLAGTPNYIPNYDAILQWIKSGPQTLPPAMRAGRVLYYSSIPNSIPMDWKTGLIAASGSMDQKFWKEYIDFVIGSGIHSPSASLYGYGKNNTTSTGTFGNPKITPKAEMTSSPTSDLQITPYMHYLDTPVHPRLHFWFGPLTMLGFIDLEETANSANQNMNINYNWNAGTTYEAHCWQLKAGINAALTDIKNNHPNDLASLIFFSSNLKPLVTMGKDFTRMQRSLFYPRTLIDSLQSLTAEKRPYQWYYTSKSNPAGIDNDNFTGDIPLATGGTNPALGLMNAYNQFNSEGSYTGRRGALKIVILETDGVANQAASGSLTSIAAGAGAMEWTGISQGANFPEGSQNAIDSAICLAWMISQDTAGSKNWPGFPAYTSRSGLPSINSPRNYYKQRGPGFSTVRSPVQVHTIAFGALFEPTATSPMKIRALEFLRNVQIAGGTSPSNASSIEDYKIIVGSYQERINLLRQCMRSIMQGGVIVSLIQ